MKNLKFLVPVLFFISCQKQSQEDIIPTAHSVTKPEECIVDTNQLRSNFMVVGRGKPIKYPTTTPTPTPTGTGYSCIYLDFNGQTVNSQFWNNGSTLQCAPSGLTAEQIATVVNKVSTAYSSYRVTVTADESVYLNANQNMRIRVIVTPTSAWSTGVSGITYKGSFSWGDETPSFVFSDRLFYGAGYIGEIASHEAGHSLGLSHQTEWDTNCQLVSSYRMGVIMGNSLYVPQGAWTYGTSLTCTTYQDDNAVLSNKLGVK